jgi:hypothetical protein
MQRYHRLVSSRKRIEILLRDRFIYTHFVARVLCLLFPVLQAGSDDHTLASILQFLFAAGANRHYCLATSAMHMAVGTRIQNSKTKEDTLRHVHVALCELQYLSGSMHSQVQSVLVLKILVDLPLAWVAQLPWQVHFHATIILIQRPYRDGQLLLSVTLTICIDLLRATMLGQKPLFARLYQEYRGRRCDSGLLRLLGFKDVPD